MSHSAFTSWQGFFLMGGYGFYIWFAVAITLLSLLGLLVHTSWQHRRILAQLSCQKSREQRIRQSQQSKQPSTTTQPAHSREKSL